MVVLDEDGPGAAVDLLEHLPGKGPVHRGVGLPVGLVEGGFDEGIVAQRPQPLVGDAVVVALLFLFGQPDQPQGVGRVVGRDHHAVAVVHRQVVSGAAAVGDPSPGAFLHQRVDGGGHAARGSGDAEIAFHQFVNVGLAVGDTMMR